MLLPRRRTRRPNRKAACAPLTRRRRRRSQATKSHGDGADRSLIPLRFGTERYQEAISNNCIEFRVSERRRCPSTGKRQANCPTFAALALSHSILRRKTV